MKHYLEGEGEICTLENMGPSWIHITKTWEIPSRHKVLGSLRLGGTACANHTEKYMITIQDTKTGEYVLQNVPYPEARLLVNDLFQSKTLRQQLLLYARRKLLIRGRYSVTAYIPDETH